MHSSGDTDGHKADRLPPPKFQFGWYLACTAVIVATLAFIWVNWHAVPDPMPTHSDASGTADGFSGKSFPAAIAHVGLGPAITTAVCAGAGGILVGIANQTKDGLHDKPERAINRQRLLMQLMQPMLGKFSFALVVVLLLSITAGLFEFPVVGTGAIAIWLLIGAFLAVGFGIVVRSARIMQELDERYPPDDPRDKLKYGMFYHNPDNPRLWVELESGMNFTLNFAHRAAWWIAGVFAAIIAVVILLPIFLA
ncbi:DUF1648 domain-containing protein [Corynebacterium pseudodiphtheriticum]|uniref:DUF1648 domain-containing protein n=1 Tax=Corynebacterium pseudodiphtheriticum TaxID=37637 RepID=UPI00254A4CB5|nr:DUF1648 domain-containing protein [Corynebacterium pseudodiphtheriticum]MDK8718155.1 DUF1648 domain-containing protein [Corynebacterium pseudodiphtheriticum]